MISSELARNLVNTATDYLMADVEGCECLNTGAELVKAIEAVKAELLTAKRTEVELMNKEKVE